MGWLMLNYPFIIVNSQCPILLFYFFAANLPVNMNFSELRSHARA